VCGGRSGIGGGRVDLVRETYRRKGRGVLRANMSRPLVMGGAGVCSVFVCVCVCVRVSGGQCVWRCTLPGAGAWGEGRRKGWDRAVFLMHRC
jgi:hypothetical protein